MFVVLELVFQGVECVFQDVEHKFQGDEYKIINREEKTAKKLKKPAGVITTATGRTIYNLKLYKSFFCLESEAGSGIAVTGGI